MNTCMYIVVDCYARLDLTRALNAVPLNAPHGRRCLVIRGVKCTAPCAATGTDTALYKNSTFTFDIPRETLPPS